MHPIFHKSIWLLLVNWNSLTVAHSISIAKSHWLFDCLFNIFPLPKWPDRMPLLIFNIFARMFEWLSVDSTLCNRMHLKYVLFRQRKFRRVISDIVSCGKISLSFVCIANMFCTLHFRLHSNRSSMLYNNHQLCDTRKIQRRIFNWKFCLVIFSHI